MITIIIYVYNNINLIVNFPIDTQIANFNILWIKILKPQDLEVYESEDLQFLLNSHYRNLTLILILCE